MITIWKYKISLEHSQDIEMPADSRILVLHKQGSRQEDEIYLWCLVDTDKPKETRSFFFAITGEELLCGKNCNYVGTLWLMNGNYVLHLFELLKG